MPGTKDKPMYMGPFEVADLTDSHLIAKTGDKMKKYPIHLTRKYYSRFIEVSIFLVQYPILHFPILTNNNIRIQNLMLHLLWGNEALTRSIPQTVKHQFFKQVETNTSRSLYTFRICADML